MSASAIKDGLVTNLSAASVLGASAVDTHYAIMEKVKGASCVVIGPPSLDPAEPETFGGKWGRLWRFPMRGFVKHANPLTLMNNTIALIDDVVSSLESDRTLQGTAEEIVSIRSNHEPGEVLTAGGAEWTEVVFNLEIREWPGG